MTGLSAQHTDTSSSGSTDARLWVLGGRVQGVGFRPFVYRLAQRHGLSGWVRNTAGRVEIHTEGGERAQQRFGEALLCEPPPASRPVLLSVEQVAPEALARFSILASRAVQRLDAHVPVDNFVCDDCLAEMTDPADRRHRYPFINCTQCGPRYTLIERLPYDRANTAMAGFPLCPACRREYEDPADRRFHAEPLACPVCGPVLTLVLPDARIADTAKALEAAVAVLKDGRILAVKGVGGYHLMCDARSEAAVARLRRKKRREHKPLAVMFPAAGADGLERVERAVELSDPERDLLRSVERPIVLASKKDRCDLSAPVAPGLREVGVFLPYSPLHHLLLEAFDGPLVATSGNLSGEPVLTDNGEARSRLAPVADGFLHHDRPIVRPADDSVYRRIRGRCRPIRAGRGLAPLELALPRALPFPVLAAGGHMKNTLALAWDERIVVSPHIGDMASPRSLRVFEQVAGDLQRLYGVHARAVVCDAHPGYATRRWAEAGDLPVHPVFHHRAHASALAGEHALTGSVLVFTWDGVGLGEDGTLWGGEALFGRAGAWRRVASLRPFRLPGGDKAAREPWRSALGTCWETGAAPAPDLAPVPDADRDLLFQAWQKRLNAPLTSAAGRLFDAAAALTGVCRTATFEGQGPMLLEAVASPDVEPLMLPLERSEAGLWLADWRPLLAVLADGDAPVEYRAGLFHATLADVLTQQALHIRAEQGVETVGLAGGVFQNRLLTETAGRRLAAEGFEVVLNAQVPVNDGGLSFGQVIEFAASTFNE